MSLPVSALDTSAPTTSGAAPSRRSFARRRLLLGISGVGATVVLSIVWLVVLLTDVGAAFEHWRVAPGPLGLAATAALLVFALFLAHAALLLPVEYRGGAVVVRERPRKWRWFRGWLRGVAVQGTLLATLVFATALCASFLGWFGAVLAVAGGGVALLAGQGPLARLVAPLKVQPASEAIAQRALADGIRPDVVRVVEAGDVAFVGGWVGVRRPQLWIPERWTAAEHHDLLAVQFARRHAVFVTGARRRGLWRAVAWPAIGVACLTPLLPWSFSDPRFWLALPAVSTLWSFLAVLVLPAFSRVSVYGADARAAARLGISVVSRAIRQLDRWQDDEAERTPGVEAVFHPVPSRGNRERALQRRQPPKQGGGHQQTRLTLLTSLAAGSLLGRVVHCSIGRPSLWVVYPGD